MGSEVRLAEGVSRSKMLRKNILFSGILKAIGLCTSFLIVPVTLNYLDNEPYGLWMTISSMAFWIFTFDIGLGNGMRNYLTSAISNHDEQLAQTHISSTFAMLTLLAVVMALIAVPLVLTLDFRSLLKTNSMDNSSLQFIILVALILTLVNFVVKNIGFIFVAMQKYAVNDLLTVGGNVAALILIFILTKFTEGNLLNVVAVFMAMPVAVFVLGGIPLFARHPQLRPRVKSIDMKYCKTIACKGLGFFFIQVTSCLVIFGGSNVLISHFLGPESVTTYNIAYKYFYLLMIGYTVVIAPMWNAYTDAQVKGDWQWIRHMFRKAMLMWGGTVLVGLVMLLLCNVFYQLWVGDAVSVPFSVSVSVMFFIAAFNLNNCVTYLLNGLNTIRVQIYTSVITTFAYLGVLSVFGHSWGIEGIVNCMSVCYFTMSMIHLYQCHLLINQKASGIWSK